jgi:flavin reductase (DIM6/NTAB) family NADH-FMN oxidoreductase RutF
MSRWASGLTVVTTRLGSGIHGMTANSFCSVSLDPPLVLVCVLRGSRSHILIPEQRAFGVHLLVEGQAEVCRRAAGLLGDEGNLLEDMPVRTEVTGAPILEQCGAWMDCSLWAEYDGGDHVIYVGQVEAAGIPSIARPLLWHDRGFHRLAGE